MFLLNLDTALNISHKVAERLESSVLGSIAISLDKLPPSGAECLFVASLPCNQYAYMDLFVVVQDETLFIWDYGTKTIGVDLFIDLMINRKHEVNILK